MRTSLRSLLAVLALGCGSTPVSPDGPGLEGLVARGPITPVCDPSVSCDAPFAADFEVLRNNVPVASFRSSAAGYYRVSLQPGNCVVRPAPTAPLLHPTTQTRAVEIQPAGWTRVDLLFDTGIR